MAASGVQVINGGFRAFYSPVNDRIHLPARASFPDAPAYYGTALHECAHATGHERRLNRQFGRRFGDAAYAMEELVAELASAYLCSHCRIDGRLQHTSYTDSWLKVLGGNPRAVFTAAADAQKARTSSLPIPSRRRTWRLPPEIGSELLHRVQVHPLTPGAHHLGRRRLIFPWEFLMDNGPNNPFRRLMAIDVSRHVEQKGGFSYLSWPYAVA